jgi:hypothetical protein
MGRRLARIRYDCRPAQLQNVTVVFSLHFPGIRNRHGRSEDEEHVDVEPGGKIVCTAGGYPIAIPAIYCQAGIDNDIVRYPPDGGLRTVRTGDVSPGREHRYSSGRSRSPVPGPTTGDKKPNRPGRDR